MITRLHFDIDGHTVTIRGRDGQFGFDIMGPSGDLLVTARPYTSNMREAKVAARRVVARNTKRGQTP